MKPILTCSSWDSQTWRPFEQAYRRPLKTAPATDCRPPLVLPDLENEGQN